MKPTRPNKMTIWDIFVRTLLIGSIVGAGTITAALILRNIID